MILLTVGSMFPFDRLVRAVDELLVSGRLSEQVHAQIGTGQYEPKAMPFDRFLDKPQFDALLREADAIVSHAGIGSIATALRYDKPILVLPRLARHGEHVNDHQLATARKFAELGHLLCADSEEELLAGLQSLRGFRPRARHADPACLARRVGEYLARCD